MVERDEQETLAEIRTYLALERTYLAEERTAFAQLRTGLTLAVVAPPASVVVTSLLPPLPPHFLDLLVYLLFAVPTLLGIWMSLHSRARLGQVQKKKKVVRTQIAKLGRSVKADIQDYILPDDDRDDHLLRETLVKMKRTLRY